MRVLVALSYCGDSAFACVGAAVDAGQIRSDRWESYRILLEELEGQPEEWE